MATQPLTIVTACVNYADYLALTLPYAVQLGRVIVATAPGDRETAEVVAANPGAECFVTDAWTRTPKDKFNKGRGLNEAIRHAQPEWLLLADSDIILPPIPPNASELDRTKFYGTLRRMCDTVEQWRDCLIRRAWFELPVTTLPPFLGRRATRAVWGAQALSNPIGVQGYFQLWHYPSNKQRLLQHPTAAKYDVHLAAQWPSEKRELVPWPDYTVIHLGERRVNWYGRVADRWCVDKIPAGVLEQAAVEHYAKAANLRHRDE